MGEDCAPPVAPTLPGAVPLCVGVGVVDGVGVVLWLPPSVVPVWCRFHTLAEIGLPVPSSMKVMATRAATNTTAAVATVMTQPGRPARNFGPRPGLLCRPSPAPPPEPRPPAPPEPVPPEPEPSGPGPPLTMVPSPIRTVP